MPDDEQSRSREIQQELRLSRKFSLADAIGQEAGDFMKGESPVPKLVQVKTELSHLVSENLQDSSGALQVVLGRWITADESRISRYLNTPADALIELIQRILKTPDSLYELVRQADSLWGEMYDERPYFQRPGQAPHPDDEYTHESVREALAHCLRRLQDGQSAH
jgi:hypothetical protein